MFLADMVPAFITQIDLMAEPISHRVAHQICSVLHIHEKAR
jgi:hypothetical protein